jgi:hypothetical protein
LQHFDATEVLQGFFEQALDVDRIWDICLHCDGFTNGCFSRF